MPLPALRAPNSRRLRAVVVAPIVATPAAWIFRHIVSANPEGLFALQAATTMESVSVTETGDGKIEIAITGSSLRRLKRRSRLPDGRACTGRPEVPRRNQGSTLAGRTGRGPRRPPSCDRNQGAFEFADTDVFATPPNPCRADVSPVAKNRVRPQAQTPVPEASARKDAVAIGTIELEWPPARPPLRGIRSVHRSGYDPAPSPPAIATL